jgi:tetratricopeptide (TPR) repeat protein
MIMTDKVKNVAYIGLLFAVILVVLLLLWLVLKQVNDSQPTDSYIENIPMKQVNDMRSTDSYIENIPYVGKHNNLGKYRQPYSRNDMSASTISILEYWNPNSNSIEEIDKLFNSFNLESNVYGQVEMLHELADIKDYVDFLGGYDSKLEKLETSEMFAYLENGIPLLINLPIDPESSEEARYFPTSVLIGMDIENEKLIFDSYWMGPDYTISFSEFDALQNLRLETRKNLFLIIQPEDVRDVVKVSTSTHYRPVVPNETAELFKLYALARGAKFSEQYSLAEKYFNELTSEKTFSINISPIDRVIILSRFSEVKYALGDFEAARVVALQAVEINFDLDVPFQYFGSYKYLLDNNAQGYTDRMSLPYLVLGDAYRALGDLESALESYREAILILPWHVGPKEAIKEIETQLGY